MKAAAIVAFILAATLMVMAFFVLATSAKADSTCYFVDLEKISEESVEGTRESLFKQGWYADSLDGGEFLYTPSCAASFARVAGEIETQALLEEVRALRVDAALLGFSLTLRDAFLAHTEQHDRLAGVAQYPPGVAPDWVAIVSAGATGPSGCA